MVSPDENMPPRQNVRFASNAQGIEPDGTLIDIDAKERDDLSPEARRELLALSQRMQMSRMHSGYEPVSLPSSRAPSPGPAQALNQGGRAGQRQSPAPSPPLTPADTPSREARPSTGEYSSSKLAQVDPGPGTVTPKMSPPHGTHIQAKQQPRFSIGGADSEPVSRESSPSDAAGHKRLPWARNVDEVEDTAKFPPSSPHGSFSGPASTHLPRSSGKSGSTSDLKSYDVKHHSWLLGGLRHNKHDENHDVGGTEKPHGSMHNLKRFFKMGGHKHKQSVAETENNEHPPSRSARSSVVNASGTSTPPHQAAQTRNIPFADDHGLEQKYGRVGRILGSGAGGSVRLLKRTSDGTVFAVKQFRPRHATESQKQYFKKISAEYMMGSTFHHCNVIETLELLQENGTYYEVMEYAPYDLFATVMSGKMSRAEIACATVQILNGVAYLHSLGVAHRDLKLDNVVINKDGIMKLIDFGSAVVFQYPGETGIELAEGIVGSDPYLAPEVYEQRRYDPRPADVWSIAIVFCCMTLRRFPWKAPRSSDSSYRLFVAEPSPGHPVDERRRYSEAPAKLSAEAAKAEQQRRLSAPIAEGGTSRHHQHQNTNATNGGEQSNPSSRAPSGREGSVSTAPVSQYSKTGSTSEQETIRGPWRLLRLLPRESRHIIMRMLDLNPARRATMEEVFEEPWIQNIPVCRQEPDGTVIRGEGHTHALEAPAAPAQK